MPGLVLQRARDKVPHCLVAALFDPADGCLLSSSAAPEEVASRTMTAAVAMRDLLRRSWVDDDSDPGVEVVVASRERLHVGLRSRANPGVALLFVCRREASLGMALARARIILTEVEEVL